MTCVKLSDTSATVSKRRTVVRWFVEQQQRWLENLSASQNGINVKVNLDEKRASEGKSHPSDQSEDATQSGGDACTSNHH